MESCVDVLENPRRVRCFSLCEPDGLKSLMGGSLLNTRNAVFFFDYTCLERSDLLEAAGKLVNAIWENRLGEVVTPCHAGFIGALAKRVPCPWEREGGRETFYPAAKNEYHGLGCAAIQRASKKVADSVARQVFRQAEIDANALRQATQDMAKEKEPKKPLADLKPRHAVDKLRTADILQAMIMRNATDRAIPEEWMDELSDLVWRERDGLGANTED